jgi:hypothetical protein
MIIGTVYSSACFSYNKEKKVFTGEISEVPQVLRQLYVDSMDLGFGIQSAKTGNIVYYTLTDMVRDRDDDGDAIAWNFTLSHYSALKNPGAAGTSVVIYND